MSSKQPNKAAKTRAARRAVVAAGKVAGEALARAAAPNTAPDDDFGGEDYDRELAQEAGEELGPPPPAPVAPRAPSEQPSEPPAALVALGPPPDDALAAQAWMHKAMIVSAHDAMTDKTISPATRRRELRTIAITAARLVPNRDLFEAREIVKRSERELEERRRAKMGARLEERPRAQPGGGTVIPIRKPNG